MNTKHASRCYDETEHQELFYPGARVSAPLPVRIPSALGPLKYYVAARVPREWADRFAALKVRATLKGLRSTDVTAAWGDGVSGDAVIASKARGLVWLLLARLPMARGEGTLTFSGLPAGLEKLDLLLCTWRRFMESGQADDWIRCQADPAWAPSGVPLGGIGVGRVDICRDGRFRNFSGNNNQDMPFEEPDGLAGAFLSVALEGNERLLATRAAEGIAPVNALVAELQFPQATLTAPGAFPGVAVSARLSGPMIPHDVEESALPCALLRWEVRNDRPTAVRVACRWAWPNLVGQGGGIGEPEKRTGYGDGFYRFWTPPNEPSCDVIAGSGWRGLRYGNAPSPISASADGVHLLACRSGEGVVVEPHATRGSVRATLLVPPHASATVDMVLLWDMPHWIDSLGVDRGIHWRGRFADGAMALDHLFAQFSALMDGAASLQRLLDETDLPRWMRLRLLNCRYPLVSNSVFYPDGRFSINEGPTEMAGVYGTIDQRLAAHPATHLFYPRLDRTELDLFTATMNEAGEVNHDLGGGHIERTSAGQRWPDIQCSYALLQARNVWNLGDKAAERNLWPKVRLALERHGRWADEGGGVAQLGHRTGLGTSYDSYHYEGSTAYIGTLWIAALLVGIRWAENVGDTAFAGKAARWIEQAVARLDADLWNGRFYRAFGGKDVPSNENCHGGMLAGEYYARSLAGADVLGAGRLRACAEALLERQGSKRFAVPPDEVSVDGSTGSEFGWLPYIEAFMAAPLAILGEERILPIWERMVGTMQGDGKHPCDTRLMYIPTTGDPSWGASYMTAPASWLVYEGLLDFMYRPDEATLRLCPLLEGRFAIVHPLFWALGERTGNDISVRVRRVFAKRPLAVEYLETTQKNPRLKSGGRFCEAAATRGAYHRFKIRAVNLAEGAVISWTVSPV